MYSERKVSGFNIMFDLSRVYFSHDYIIRLTVAAGMTPENAELQTFAEESIAWVESLGQEVYIGFTKHEDGTTHTIALERKQSNAPTLLQ